MSLPNQYPHELMPVTPQMEKEMADLMSHAGRLNLAITPALFMSVKVGAEEERFKCNSYNRNYWNALATLFTGNYDAVSSNTGHDFGEGYLNLEGYNLLNIAHASTNNAQTNPTGGAASGGVVSAFCGTSTPTAASPMGTSGGICVGTSDDLEDFDFSGRTDNIILHGSSDGQLYYYAPSAKTTKDYDSATKTYKATVTRTFQNNGSIDVTVKDVLVNTWITGYRPGVGSTYALGCTVERSVFPTPVVVPAGEFLTVTYELVFIYPEPEVTP